MSVKPNSSLDRVLVVFLYLSMVLSAALMTVAFVAAIGVGLWLVAR